MEIHVKNINYEDILAGFQQRKMDNSNITDNRKQEIYKNIPEIMDIDHQIASISMDAARKRLRKLEVDKEAVRRENEKLIGRKKELLVSHGYPADYLEPVYTCPICHDTGYVGTSKCSCLKQQIIRQLYNQSTIQSKLEEENFSTFSLEYYNKENDGVHKHTPYDNASGILKRSHEFVDNFHERRPGILIYGETGLGKTFLSNCIAKSLLDKGHTVLYLTSSNLFENVLSDVIMNNSRDKDKLMLYDYIYNCELLIIDDLGTEVTNSFVTSQLFEIINMRNTKSLSTLISTNLSMKQLQERYSERIMSRIISDYIVFNFYGDNIRYTKRKMLVENKINGGFYHARR
jgi:DNA replication protein DnaC